MAEKTTNYKPQDPSRYRGKQIILNSGRLVFNAKSDSLLLYSNRVIGFSANDSFHFDTSKDEKSKFIVNSPNILLGLKYDDSLPTEPAVLGNELLEVLKEILDLIDKVYFDLSFNISFITSKPGKLTTLNKKNWNIYKKRNNQRKTLSDSLESIKSTKVKLT